MLTLSAPWLLSSFAPAPALPAPRAAVRGGAPVMMPNAVPQVRCAILWAQFSDGGRGAR